MINNTDEFFPNFAIWCAYSVVLLLSPTLVRDVLRRTRAMQWTSRRGWQVLDVQMGGALLSGLLLTRLNCASTWTRSWPPEPCNFGTVFRSD